MSAKTVLCVSKDAGNFKTGECVAQALRARGAGVVYGLDACGAVWQGYDQHSVVVHSFRPLTGPKSIDASVRGADAVVVTLSASGLPNAEIAAVRAAKRLGKPVYGVEDVPRGRHNPGWQDDTPPPVRELSRLFTVMRTDEDDEYVGVTVVGPTQLKSYRDVDVDAVGRVARHKLRIPEDTPLVWFSGHPAPESPHALLQVGWALAQFPDPKPVLIVSRHSRDKGIPDNGVVHRHVLRLIQSNAGVRVIENSRDHEIISEGHPDAVPAEFRSHCSLEYSELVCACKQRGVVVTGFGTDGLIVAPHLHIPSILFLDGCEEPRRPFLLGRLAVQEKGTRTFPLRVVCHCSHTDALVKELTSLLYDEDARRLHCMALAGQYSFPQQDPAELIADIILEAMA